MLSRKVIIGKNKQAPYVPGGFKIQIETATNGQSFTLPLVNPTTMGAGTGYNFVVTWGDGNSNTISTYNDANISHTYLSAGTYDIEIKGQCDGWSFNNSGSKLLLTKVLSWGNDDFDGFCSLYNGFWGCSNLNELPENQSIKERLHITNFYYCFYNCTSLQTIPSGLFDNNVNVTSFAGCFRETGITTIPSGLFDNNVNATNFQDCFCFCYSLQTIPSGLFDNNVNATNFKFCFSGASITTIPSGLFDNNINVTSFEECFSYCQSITTIPNGLFDNNVNVISFERCFYYSYLITTIPNGLFDNNVNVISYKNCFYYCIYLNIINIFNYSNFLNKSINFENMFSRPSFDGTQGTAPDLWNADFGTGTPITTGCFGGAGNSVTSLTNYNDIPAAWK